MENFDYKKYLAEGRLLKEDLTITGEYEGEPVIITLFRRSKKTNSILPRQ